VREPYGPQSRSRPSRHAVRTGGTASRRRLGTAAIKQRQKHPRIPRIPLLVFFDVEFTRTVLGDGVLPLGRADEEVQEEARLSVRDGFHGPRVNVVDE
jgi:hypothetical protein